jgi:hypothetical protein
MLSSQYIQFLNPETIYTTIEEQMNAPGYALRLSTILYTTTAILLTVNIQPQTILYFNHTHLLKSLHWHSTVATMAIYRSRWVVWDNSTMLDFGYTCLQIIYCAYIL